MSVHGTGFTHQSFPGLMKQPHSQQTGDMSLQDCVTIETERRLRQACSLSLSFVGGLVILFSVNAYFLGLTFPMDDAYIVTHNVQVMRNGGNDPNFVGAPVLSGTTSIVHLVLIYIPSIFTSPLFAQYLITCLAVILYALGLIGLSLNRGLSRIQAALVTVLGLIAAEVPHQLLNGLETGLAMGALVWFLVFVSESRKAWIVSLLCGLLPFVRPELAMVSVVVFVRRIWIVWNQKDSMMGFFKEVRSSVVFLALGSIPWAMAYFFSMGSPYPTTISAKKYFFAEFAYETVPAAVALVFRGLATFLYKVTLVQNNF
jgi:hypothetical protein